MISKNYNCNKDKKLQGFKGYNYEVLILSKKQMNSPVEVVLHRCS